MSEKSSQLVKTFHFNIDKKMSKKLKEQSRSCNSELSKTEDKEATKHIVKTEKLSVKNLFRCILNNLLYQDYYLPYNILF